MISIATPSDSAEQVYVACAERTQDSVLRTALKNEAMRVTQRSEMYLSKAAAGELYSITPDNAQNISNAKLAELYERVLVKGGEHSALTAGESHWHVSDVARCADSAMLKALTTTCRAHSFRSSALLQLILCQVARTVIKQS